MALILDNVENESGVRLEYVKISNVVLEENRLMLNLRYFKDEDARANKKKPINQNDIPIVYELSEIELNAFMAQFYAKLKSDTYPTAIDVDPDEWKEQEDNNEHQNEPAIEP